VLLIAFTLAVLNHVLTSVICRSFYITLNRNVLFNMLLQLLRAANAINQYARVYLTVAFDTDFGVATCNGPPVVRIAVW